MDFVGVNSLKMFVLDEADEMLSRGFKEQIYEVFKNLPGNVQARTFAWFDGLPSFIIR